LQGLRAPCVISEHSEDITSEQLACKGCERRSPQKNASGVIREENSCRITSEFSAKERQWRYRRGEFWQDYVRILRKRTPVALQERRIPAGLHPNSPQKNASGVTGEENSCRITSEFSTKERQWRYRRGEFLQDYI